jgi:hypothetical protein
MLGKRWATAVNRRIATELTKEFAAQSKLTIFSFRRFVSQFNELAESLRHPASSIFSARNLWDCSQKLLSPKIRWKLGASLNSVS